MRRTNYGGPRLPAVLLDKVDSGRVGKKRDASRKDKRKQERLQKKSVRAAPRPQRRVPVPQEESDSEDDQPIPPAKPTAKAKGPTKDAKPTKSILKQRPEPEADEVEDESEDDGELELGKELAGPSMSKKGAKAKLEDDDAEIAALEKKLGIKGNKSKKTGDDELDWLLYGSDGDGDAGPGTKRKHPEDDDWLKSKRRKAAAVVQKEEEPEDSEDEDDEIEEPDFGDFDRLGDSDAEDAPADFENPFSEDELSEGDFDDFDDGDGDASDMEDLTPAPAKKVKENPYVAPVAKDDAAPAAKYVPPSMRKAPSSDEEVLKQLRRQLQGLLNRLSEANLISILQSVQEVYTNNARQYVTSTLVDLLRGLVCDPAVLNDTFLILHAGFAASLHRTVGTDFGAQMLEAIAQAFDEHYSKDASAEGKQALNLLAFLANLYTLNAISSDILFDYIRMLLERENFSENSTELLVRVIRVSGQQLRSDDPTALKDIVLLLHRTISAIGKDNVSVRTQFMVEQIDNLKNNRVKTGVAASALSAEHMQRMKKTLGSIKTVKTTEPLRIGLADLRDADKKGKWWLVGASWQPKNEAKTTSSKQKQADSNHDADASDVDEQGGVDLDKLARQQGMNTDVRRAIFIAVTGAIDPEHAFLRLQKLNLKNKQQVEIPRVLLHCVGAEPVYNHFYTLIACRFCGDHKMWKAWQFALLDIFRRLGETQADADDEPEESEEMDVKKVYNLAKLYATLVAERLLRITILKTLDFGALASKTRVFVETMLVTIMILLRKKAHQDGFEGAVKQTFEQAHAVPEMLLGLKYYLTSVVPESEVIGNRKEAKVVASGCEYAVDVLNETRKGKIAVEEDLSDVD
ncbi:Suppressor of glycerol defect protein 1 [Fulvia fulva]|uniref:Suppressor of glycerol defect protein 1 n=1 Tax=Passalora fulva TaxID=5499 RepID=A0A9Q8PFI6_PASFU|nr:Suppressor of glycerol defect protein 1 [Fulvia fulva]KAK4613486.1 Suppressor of glycerol defect protein 1 [Fulvia fulva]KAK4614440.1 Suppressor of glycerol defect protein 1 [Fulvia fulva]UJO21543.1 Suppressor of glycerol defect protein 1 [Fulvia fulva]WPV20642.1 Suppressor of glycerol defect protein 1 [Fulvia fulva]WPV35747.1 Suppressor of glycerol defect protein 1 [Fulvia fulva]